MVLVLDLLKFRLSLSLPVSVTDELVWFALILIDSATLAAPIVEGGGNVHRRCNGIEELLLLAFNFVVSVVLVLEVLLLLQSPFIEMKKNICVELFMLKYV